MILKLSRAYASIHGAPSLTRVDSVIFEHRYFTRCMQCTFCDDACCRHGVDVDEPNVLRILARAETIAKETGVPPGEWFEPGFEADPEHPGGRFTRTRVRGGHCVFHRMDGRGCVLHAHGLKPMVSALFPLTFDDGLLHASTEIEDGTLVCGKQGPTLYRGVRDELGHYFGPTFVAEVDALEFTRG
jgi:hypothetical protein